MSAETEQENNIDHSAVGGHHPSSLLALERAYDAFKACENRAIWGGSCEVEMAAQQDMRAHGRTMFAALEAFMVDHKANVPGELPQGRAGHG